VWVKGIVYFWLVEGDVYRVFGWFVFNCLVVGDIGEVEIFYDGLGGWVEDLVHVVFIYALFVYVCEDRFMFLCWYFVVIDCYDIVV